MRRFEKAFFSRNLNRDMGFICYGHGGKPVIAIPTQNGHLRQWEEFGMPEILSGYINSGKIQLFLADALDEENISSNAPLEQRAWNLENYSRYLADELAPAVLDINAADSKYRAGGVLVSGFSAGAFHAANVFFRNPNVFDAVIALSGVYSTRLFFGGWLNDVLYYNSPTAYLQNQDAWHLQKYRQSKMAFCCGQGAWEDEMLREIAELKAVLDAKGVGATVDVWGRDVNHDWPWWKKQMPYFLDKFLR